MRFKRWNDICLCAQEDLFPADAVSVDAPFAPLVFLVQRDGENNRGLYAVSALVEVWETESVRCLTPLEPSCAGGDLEDFVAKNGATVLNVTFSNAFSVLQKFLQPKRSGFRVTLVGLGDVGGTVLTGLKLLGHEIDEVAIYDPNTALCSRYEMELNQVLAEKTALPMPKVTVCAPEQLFDCDLFVFTATRGVPPLGTQVRDVRMAQFDANRAMLDAYAKAAREAKFAGLFCQVSDPVDHLAREVFLRSNQTDDGVFDANGLLPEQVQGFGLGVMAARAAYYADKEGVDFSEGRAYGPHGQGLIVANHPAEAYDADASLRLTELARTANLHVRDLGFKPYIAPGLSSAAISILRLLRGEEHYGAVALDGAYFGCVSRMTRQGIALRREPICEELLKRLEETHSVLRAFDYKG